MSDKKTQKQDQATGTRIVKENDKSGNRSFSDQPLPQSVSETVPAPTTKPKGNKNE